MSLEILFWSFTKISFKNPRYLLWANIFKIDDFLLEIQKILKMSMSFINVLIIWYIFSKKRLITANYFQKFSSMDRIVKICNRSLKKYFINWLIKTCYWKSWIYLHQNISLEIYYWSLKTVPLKNPIFFHFFKNHDFN